MALDEQDKQFEEGLQRQSVKVNIVTSIVSAVATTILIGVTLGTPLYNMSVGLQLLNTRVTAIEKRNEQYDALIQQRNQQYTDIIVRLARIEESLKAHGRTERRGEER